MNLLNMLAMCAGMMGGQATAEGGAEAQQGGSSWYIIVIYVVIFAAFIYFIMIRPQRKNTPPDGTFPVRWPSSPRWPG